MSAAFLGSALIQFVLGLVVAWILGPAEFGAYAIALAAAILVQTVLFEWARLAATRFHHAGDDGRLTRRLGRVLALIALAMLAVAGLASALAGGRRWIFVLVPLIAVAAGFADFRGALLRAEFDQRRYALFMVLRNLLAILLLPMAAYRFGSAEAALAAFLLAILIASAGIEIVLRSMPDIGKPAMEPGLLAEDLGPVPEMAALLRYAGPIVLTNCLYLGLFFGLRFVAALTGGFAAAGQVSLALDFTLKLFTTIGTALDLVLFQLAVRESRARGVEAGLARLKVNSQLVLAALLPIALGLFLIIPQLTGFLVAPQFREVFPGSVVLLLPGVALYALVQYALHPYLQLAHRTPRLAQAALASLVIAGILFSGMSAAGFTLFSAIGMALGGGMLAACLVLVRAIGPEVLPSPGFVARLGLALGAMGLVVLLVRNAGTGIVPLTTMIIAGATAYAAAAYVLDLAGLRALLNDRKSATLTGPGSG